MRNFLGILAVAGLVTFGAGAASAQGLDVRIGVGDPAPRYGVVQERYERPRYVQERPRYDRRYERGPRVRTVCRTVMREHVRPSGRVVARPVEVCRQVAGRQWRGY